MGCAGFLYARECVWDNGRGAQGVLGFVMSAVSQIARVLISTGGGYAQMESWEDGFIHWYSPILTLSMNRVSRHPLTDAENLPQK